MKKVKINRANWACGGRYQEHRVRGNSLFNSETNGVCCLGFATNQLCKIPIFKLNLKSRPSYLGSFLLSPSNEEIAKLFGFDNLDKFRDFESEAIKINDNPKLAYTRREKQILNLFKKYDIDVEFYGEYTK